MRAASSPEIKASRANCLAAVFSLLVTSSFGEPAFAQESQTKWSYFEATGPAFWGNLAKEFSLCAKGQMQSPIDLDPANAAQIRANKERLIFDYTPSTFEVADTGHHIQVNVKSMSSLEKNREVYRLIHFHLHSPSEHTWKASRFPLELHFVHRSMKGELAVVAVFVRKGEENPEANKFINNLPGSGQTISNAEIVIDLEKLLPRVGGYISYSGSLTTPPCTEGVNWNILGAPITFSERQIATITARYAFNARDIQQTNTRKIQILK